MATNPDLAVKAVEVTSVQLTTLAGGGSLTSGNDTYTANTATMYLTEDTSVLYESQTLTSSQQAQVRTNIGLGTAATVNTGTSSGNVPVLDSNGKLSSSVVPSVIT